MESYSLGLMADACIKNKRYGQALDFLKQAQLRLDEENCERFYAAEIYRLLGETYLDRTKIWIRRSIIFVKVLKSRANRKPNPLNLGFA